LTSVLVRQELTQSISQGSDVVVWAEAKNSEQTLGTMASIQVNSTIVNTSLVDSTCGEVVQEIKLRCLSTPVLAIQVLEF